MKTRVYQADWLDHIQSGIDFRRARSCEITVSIVDRAQHLQGQDRALVLAMYRDGQSAAQIARLGNLDSRQVRRKIKSALTRLTDPTFIFVVTHKANWSPTRRKIATALFQSGLSIRQTSDTLNQKMHTIRRHRAAIIDQFQTNSNPTPNHAPNRTWQNTK